MHSLSFFNRFLFCSLRKCFIWLLRQSILYIKVIALSFILISYFIINQDDFLQLNYKKSFSNYKILIKLGFVFFFEFVFQIIFDWLYTSFSLVTQSCSTLRDPMDCSTPGFPVHHQLPELIQTHVHWVGDAIQPSHPPSSPSPPGFNLSQHQGLIQ